MEPVVEFLDFKKLIKVLVNSSFVGASIINEISNSKSLNVMQKGYNNPVTRADILVQKFYTKQIFSVNSKIKIIGEENKDSFSKFEYDFEKYSKILNHDILDEKIIDNIIQKSPTLSKKVDIKSVVIFIDPLDGTIGFVEGNLQYVTSLIGITVNNIPEIGFVSYPKDEQCKKTLFLGVRNVGTTQISLEDETNSTFKVTDLLKPKINFPRLICCKTIHHENPKTSAAVECIKPSEILLIGGAGNKILNVAKGNCDVFIYSVNGGMCLWDSCAPQVILETMGGKLTQFDGNPINYASNDLGINGALACRTEEIYSDCLNKINLSRAYLNTL